MNSLTACLRYFLAGERWIIDLFREKKTGELFPHTPRTNMNQLQSFSRSAACITDSPKNNVSQPLILQYSGSLSGALIC